MKKRTKKRMLEALTIAACVTQLAEFGLELSKAFTNRKTKSSSLLHSNGQAEMSNHKIITPATM